MLTNIEMTEFSSGIRQLLKCFSHATTSCSLVDVLDTCSGDPGKRLGCLPRDIPQAGRRSAGPN